MREDSEQRKRGKNCGRRRSPGEKELHGGKKTVDLPEEKNEGERLVHEKGRSKKIPKAEGGKGSIVYDGEGDIREEEKSLKGGKQRRGSGSRGSHGLRKKQEEGAFALWTGLQASRKSRSMGEKKRIIDGGGGEGHCRCGSVAEKRNSEEGSLLKTGWGEKSSEEVWIGGRKGGSHTKKKASLRFAEGREFKGTSGID